MPYNTRYRSTGLSWSGSLPPAVKWLLVINVAIYLLEVFLRLITPEAGALFRPFFLVPNEVIRGYIWQPFTYMFLHDPSGFMHILLNMLTLWMFGTTLENTWGTRRFLEYYFSCGVGAAICVIIVALLFGQGYSATIGASGAIYGLLLAFGYLFPRQQIYMLIFPIEARWFVIIVGAMAFISSLSASSGGVSHVAHLGGMLIGYLFLRTRSFKKPVPTYGYGRTFKPPRRTGIIESWQMRYKQWKFERAKRKFEVYRKQQEERERNRDRYVH